MRPKYSAISISRSIVCARQSIARALAVFDCACNLVTARGDVIALVTPDIGNGPLNIVVDAPPGVWAGLAPDQCVEANTESIHIGHITIGLRNAAIWEPCPAWTQLARRQNRISANALHLINWLCQHYSSRGLLALLYPQARPAARSSEAAMLDTARQTASALLAAIASNDHARVGQAAAKLAGLGGGLTPAGDDFMLGVMAWLWLNPQSFGGAQASCSISKAIAEAASNKTTLLSSALLRAAGRGEFGAAWHSLFDALTGQETGPIERAAQTILGYGHTSGADALAGFLMAARAG